MFQYLEDKAASFMKEIYEERLVAIYEVMIIYMSFNIILNYNVTCNNIQYNMWC